MKDLVNAPAEQYRDIYKIIREPRHGEATHIDLLPTSAPSTDMKSELKAFLKSQLNGG